MAERCPPERQDNSALTTPCCQGRTSIQPRVTSFLPSRLKRDPQQLDGPSEWGGRVSVSPTSLLLRPQTSTQGFGNCTAQILQPRGPTAFAKTASVLAARGDQTVPPRAAIPQSKRVQGKKGLGRWVAGAGLSFALQSLSCHF